MRKIVSFYFIFGVGPINMVVPISSGSSCVTEYLHSDLSYVHKKLVLALTQCCTYSLRSVSPGEEYSPVCRCPLAHMHQIGEAKSRGKCGQQWLFRNIWLFRIITISPAASQCQWMLAHLFSQKQKQLVITYYGYCRPLSSNFRYATKPYRSSFLTIKRFVYDDTCSYGFPALPGAWLGTVFFLAKAH